MIEDTTFIIDVLHDDRDAVGYLDLIERENRPEKISTITVLELYEAVPQLNALEERRQAILDVLDTRHAVVADGTVLRKAGKIPGSLRARGKEIDREDCLIGATALLNDEPV
ncbi:PIN domain-containing protein [Halorubrum sp. 48-1-W]|uniref:PIN domain-containing protein n=1 Tax=Halorubrum sp. 48-1-W TaxID=2249761 RepID=UPI001F540A64|nr:PIN domain-containing protein [Halorubrum sp. 48-1-W]